MKLWRRLAETELTIATADARLGSALFFTAALVLPVLLGLLLSGAVLTRFEVLVATLLVLDTSLLCVLIGLLLTVYRRSGHRRATDERSA